MSATLEADRPAIATPGRVDYRTEPARYRHWRMSFDGPVATLALDVDEDGGLWVRADAELKEDLASRVSVLGKPLLAMDARHFTILTSGRKTGLDPRHRTEPVWKHVTELQTGSIGPGWIAVDYLAPVPGQP